MMTYKDDKNFNKLLNRISEFNIDYNQNHLDCLYKNLRLYTQTNEDGYLDLTIPTFFSDNYYVDLAIRELGGKASKTNEYLSKDISTFVFENYFSESEENTLSKFIYELNRITKNNLQCKVLNESKYNENNNQTTVTLEFSINENVYVVTHNDEFEDGTLMSSFILKEFLPKLEGALLKGHLLYICEEWIQFIYFENEDNYIKFTESADYYTEINARKAVKKQNEKESEQSIDSYTSENLTKPKESWWKKLWK